MISWKVSSTKDDSIEGYFPSFDIQEYLLPILNVGGPKFDEYGRIAYSVEDCVRLRNTISFAIETLQMMNKSKVRYETINEGLATFEKVDLVNTLNTLDMAAKLAVQNKVGLVFYGD